MVTWSSQLLTVRSDNPELVRRGRNCIIISFALILLALAFIPVVSIFNPNPVTLAVLVVAASIFVVTAILGRAGHIGLSSYLLISVPLVAIAISIPSATATQNTPLYMVLVILLAGVLLPSPQIWIVFVATLMATAIGAGMMAPELRDTMAWRQTLISTALLLVTSSLLVYLSARGTELALAAAHRAQAEAEQASAALATSNAELEARVEERTAALRRAVEEQRAAAAELEASLQVQRDLNRVIADLSVPIIPVRSGTLVVPLIGNLDTRRADQLLGSVLERVGADHVHTVILDVTGVPIVDTQVAASLIRVATANRLMGAATVLVGIRPEVAQALVHLGVDLATLRTAATLQDALATTFR